MTTFYFQLPGTMGRDRIWWPDQCETIEVPVNVRQLAGTDLPADYMDADLEAAAEAVCVREYKRSWSDMRDGDSITVYVSRSADVPGKPFRVRLELWPAGVATAGAAKIPARLPTAAEVAETIES